MWLGFYRIVVDVSVRFPITHAVEYGFIVVCQFEMCDGCRCWFETTHYMCAHGHVCKIRGIGWSLKELLFTLDQLPYDVQPLL